MSRCLGWWLTRRGAALTPARNCSPPLSLSGRGDCRVTLQRGNTRADGQYAFHEWLQPLANER